MSSGFECFHTNILNVFLYGLLINLIYTVCRIYIWYIRFVVYNRNILNVLLYGLLINFVYTVCCIYISYIRFAVYNNTEKRPTEPFCLGDLLGGSTLGCLGSQTWILGSTGVWDPREGGMNPRMNPLGSQTWILGSTTGVWDPQQGRRNESQNDESQTRILGSTGVKWRRRRKLG